MAQWLNGETAAMADDDCEHGILMGLGGMCFLELDLFKKTGNRGPWGLFCDVFTTPAVVAACIDNDFQDFLNPACYDTAPGKAQVWHKQYSHLRHMVTSKSCELLREWNPCTFLEEWRLASHHVPAMFHHLTRDGGLEQQLPTLHRRAARTRKYLRTQRAWKVMVWAGAIPYSYLDSLLERNPHLDPLDVLQALLGVFAVEVEELHNSLVRYGCDNFSLIGILIIHGAPPEKSHPRFLHQSVRVSESQRQRSEAFITIFESQLRGAHFVHEDGDLVKGERDRVMQFLAPYKTWQQCGPDPTYNRSYSYNPYMDLSVWDAPPELEDHSRSGDKRTSHQMAAQQIRPVRPTCISGVPPGYEYQLQMQSMQSTQDMLECAPVIVSDSTLLHWSAPCKFVTLGRDKGYIVGGYGKTLLQLPENMKKVILGVAVRHTQEKGLRRARVGYIPLQQCGYSDYSNMGVLRQRNLMLL